MSVIDRKLASIENFSEIFSIEAFCPELPCDWITQALATTGTHSKRRRALPADFVVVFLVLMGLYRRTSYGNLIGKVSVAPWCQRYWRTGKAPCSSAVTKARDRLGITPLQHLFEHGAPHWIDSSPGHYLHGLRVYALDGTTVKVPDTKCNRQFFGLPGSSRGTAAFPQGRLVALLDVGTSLVRAVKIGSYADREMKQAYEMVSCIPEGSLIAMDKGFFMYGLLWAIVHQRHSQFIVRKKRHIRPHVIQPLGEGDDLVEVSLQRPRRKGHPDLPPTWRLRRITYSFRNEKGKVETTELLTSLVDPRFTRKQIIRTYLARWQEETAYDEIKTHLCHNRTVNEPLLVRSKTPARVVQELYGILIAYNLIRKIMATSVQKQKILPTRVSFTTAVERVREIVPVLFYASTKDLQRIYDHMLWQIGKTLNPKRKKRRVQRCVRISFSPYPRKVRGLVS